jgi:hypothetical protein
MADIARPTLGPFMSLVCFQYLRLGTEEVADRAPVVASGRQRGYDLVEGLGLLGSIQDGEAIRAKLDEALGVNGTRLCLVKSIQAKPDGGYEVRISEGACTANQVSSQPHCAFTMGVFIGAIHALTGSRVKGTETQCCACGADECIYQIDPV